jgi:hypothetical protein
MKQSLRSLLAAGTVLTGLVLATAAADAATSVDMTIAESPGTYTVTNLSTNDYIYAFSVSNPLVGNGGLNSTTQQGWSAYMCYGSCVGNSSAFEFGNGTNLLSLDIGPGQTSSKFHFSGPVASQYIIDYTNGNGGYGTVTGSTTAAPIPGSLSLMLGALALLGLGYRVRRSRHAKDLLGTS